MLYTLANYRTLPSLTYGWEVVELRSARADDYEWVPSLGECASTSSPDPVSEYNRLQPLVEAVVYLCRVTCVALYG